jgi:putative SOS response-associated peptidase YedK
MVNLVWGFEPPEGADKPLTLLRSEGRRFGTRRCLIPASEFSVSNGQGKERRKWRATTVIGDFFYFAGIWRRAHNDWPASYAILTIEANPDIAPYHDRQNAVIRRDDRMSWLDHLHPQEDLLKPLPAHSFHLEQTEGPIAAPTLFDF